MSVKKILSIIMALAIVLTMASFPAFAADAVRLTYDSYTSDTTTVSWGKPLSNLFVRDDGICEFTKNMYTKPRGEGTFNLYLDPTGDVAYSVSKIEMKSAYSNHFSAFAVYGSNEAATAEAEWTLLADYTGVEGGKDVIVTREFEHEGGYKYFRFEGYGIGKSGSEVESGKPQYKFILLYGSEYVETPEIPEEPEIPEDPKPEVKEDTVEALGANIRLATEALSAGLRFGATVNKADLLIEGDYVYDETSDVQLGMYLLPKDMLAESETLEAYIAAGKPSVLDVPAKKVYTQDAETVTFTAVLVDIPAEAYAKEIVAVPYVKIAEDVTYFEEKDQSYAGVAQAALDANEAGTLTLTEEQIKALKDIVGTEEEPETPEVPEEPETPVVPDPVRLKYDSYTCSVQPEGGHCPVSNMFNNDAGNNYKPNKKMNSTELGSGEFNIYMDLEGEAKYNISKVQITTQYSNHFYSFAVYGSNEAATPEAEWTLLADVTGVTGGSNVTSNTEISHEGGYKYLRFEGYAFGKNGELIEQGQPSVSRLNFYGTECAE